MKRTADGRLRFIGLRPDDAVQRFLSADDAGGVAGIVVNPSSESEQLLISCRA
jgi:hypothetical protein